MTGLPRRLLLRWVVSQAHKGPGYSCPLDADPAEGLKGQVAGWAKTENPKLLQIPHQIGSLEH